MNKLSRTLGAEVVLPGTSKTRTHKERALSRRSASMSFPAASTDQYAHRQSSFGSPSFSSISPIHHPPRNASALSMSTLTSDYSSNSTFSYTTPSTPELPSSIFEHTPNPRPLRVDEGTQLLALDVPVDMRADAARLQSSGEVHGQPSFSLSDTDNDRWESEYGHAQTPYIYDPDEYEYGNTQTPPARLDDPDGKRFPSSFQVMPLFVVPPWEPTETDMPVGELPPSEQEWTGEWNRKDMQSVIRGLRHLRM